MAACKHLLIHGHVQGVGFRYWFSDRARQLGLAGWVRNRVDGTVEAMLRGDRDAVGEMIEQAKRGPRGARVQRVEVSDSEEVFERFEIFATR